MFFTMPLKEKKNLKKKKMLPDIMPQALLSTVPSYADKVQRMPNS